LVEEKALRHGMRVKYGDEIDEWSGPKLGIICDRLNIKYPRTPTGLPSFTSDYIEGTIHPFLDDLSELRELSKIRETFINGWILDNLVGDRIHPQWRQVATDDGGTRTGRMAAANPNPQQVPAGKYRKTGKPNNFGAKIRSLFIPHQQGLRWAKYDYSEQEPRILTHFAALCKFTRAQEMADMYNADIKFKIYPKMMEWAGGIDKRVAKDLYLGRCYGMGIKKLMLKLNMPEDQARSVLQQFDEGVPFVKEIADMAGSIAQRRGYVKTLLGRRRHFNLWEPVNSFKLRQQGMDCMPVREDQAKEKWHGLRIQRSNTHKALNAIIQGSGADMAKASMVKCWSEHKMLPYMQVHDELNYGVDGDMAEKLHSAIESSVDMRVRIVSNMTIGEHWT
jgi:DNA polymerase-1